MNKRMSKREYIEMVYAVGMGDWQSIRQKNFIDRINYVIWYKGDRVIQPRYSDQVVLFEKCDYCGSRDLSTDDVCVSCGAPAYL